MDWTDVSRLIRLALVLGVAPAVACGDDEGTTGTGDDGSTSADDDDDDDDGPSTMTDPTAPTEESSTGDTAPTTSGSSESGGSSSEGSTGATGADSSGSSGDGSSSGDSSGEGSTTSAVCEPITDDPSAINQDCMGAPCPEGYTCQDIVGFQFQQLCEIICVEDCDCPEDHVCVKHSDKTMVPWFQCDQL